MTKPKSEKLTMTNTATIIEQMRLWEGGGASPATEPVFYPPRYARTFKLYHPHDLPPCDEEFCDPKAPADSSNTYKDFNVAFDLQEGDGTDPFFKLKTTADSDWSATSKTIIDQLELRPRSKGGILTYVIDNNIRAGVEDWVLHSWRTQPFASARSVPAESNSTGNVFLDELSWTNTVTGEDIVTGWSWSFYRSSDATKAAAQQEMLNTLYTMAR